MADNMYWCWYKNADILFISGGIFQSERSRLQIMLRKKCEDVLERIA